MPLLPVQTKKRLYTPAFQTPLPKEEFMTLLPQEELDRITRNTITRQLAREAAQKPSFLSTLKENVKQGFEPLFKGLPGNIKQGVEGARQIASDFFLPESVKEKQRLKSLLTKPAYLISPEQQRKGFSPPKKLDFQDFITIDKKELKKSKDPELYKIGLYAPKKVLKSQVNLLHQYAKVSEQAEIDQMEALVMGALGMSSPLKAVTAMEAKLLAVNAVKLTRADLIAITRGVMKDAS